MMEEQDGLVVTIGAPGSGKSTWAKKTIADRCLRLERDRFRECLFGTRRAYHSHHFERGIKSRVVTEAMMSAFRAWPECCWAVTDTGLQYKAVQPFIEAALFRMVPVTFVTFDRSTEFLMQRNRYRPQPHRIPKELLIEMIALYDDPDAWWKPLRDDPNFTFVDGTAC